KMNYDTQKNRIHELLSDGAFHCVTEMMAMYIPDYRRRLCDLKDQGVHLEARRCQAHQHKGGIQEWRLADTSAVPEKSSHHGQNIAPCCESFAIFQIHSRACPSLQKQPAKTLF